MGNMGYSGSRLMRQGLAIGIGSTAASRDKTMTVGNEKLLSRQIRANK
jgi:hypothetical protein